MPVSTSTLRTPPLYDSFETLAGPISFATDGEFVREIRLGVRLKDAAPRTELSRALAAQLRAYFEGRRTEFDLPFALDTSPFTREVLETVARIPFGETLSYGDVAGAVGNPRAARAVGRAVGANPLPILIPCHRVLASNGRLGGFGGGLSWKRYLLGLEGINWPASRA